MPAEELELAAHNDASSFRNEETELFECSFLRMTLQLSSLQLVVALRLQLVSLPLLLCAALPCSLVVDDVGVSVHAMNVSYEIQGNTLFVLEFTWANVQRLRHILRGTL